MLCLFIFVIQLNQLDERFVSISSLFVEEFKEFDIKLGFKGRILRVSVRVRSVFLLLVVVFVVINERKNDVLFKVFGGKKKEFIELCLDLIDVKEVKEFNLIIFIYEEDSVMEDIFVLFVESLDKC